MNNPHAGFENRIDLRLQKQKIAIRGNDSFAALVGESSYPMYVVGAYISRFMNRCKLPPRREGDVPERNGQKL